MEASSLGWDLFFTTSLVLASSERLRWVLLLQTLCSLLRPSPHLEQGYILVSERLKTSADSMLFDHLVAISSSGTGVPVDITYTLYISKSSFEITSMSIYAISVGIV